AAGAPRRPRRRPGRVEARNRARRLRPRPVADRTRISFRPERAAVRGRRRGGRRVFRADGRAPPIFLAEAEVAFTRLVAAQAAARPPLPPRSPPRQVFKQPLS